MEVVSLTFQKVSKKMLMAAEAAVERLAVGLHARSTRKGQKTGHLALQNPCKKVTGITGQKRASSNQNTMAIILTLKLPSLSWNHHANEGRVDPILQLQMGTV